MKQNLFFVAGSIGLSLGVIAIAGTALIMSNEDRVEHQVSAIYWLLFGALLARTGAWCVGVAIRSADSTVSSRVFQATRDTSPAHR